MALRGGPHQRASGRASSRARRSSAPRASSSLRRVDVAAARSRHQRRLAVACRPRWRRRRPRAAARRSVALPFIAGELQRRHAVAVRRLDVGAGAEQPVDELEIVLAARPSAAPSCRRLRRRRRRLASRASVSAVARSPVFTACTSRGVSACASGRRQRDSSGRASSRQASGACRPRTRFTRSAR